MLWQSLCTCHLVMLLCKSSLVRTAGGEDALVVRNKRTIIGQFPLCPVGCTSCSEVNGCVTCSPNYFMLLVRRGMRQTGTCIHTCPNGYYGVRRHNFNKCYRCHVDQCDACFSRTYCTRCRPPYIAYRGSCIERCPNGLYYANYSKDCRETVDCMVGPWTGWGSCIRNGQTCGYKYGIATRTREILDSPSPTGARCPSLTENRCCRMQMRRCADLITNNSDLAIDHRIATSPIHKRRHRKKNRKHRKQRKRKNRKHKKGKKNKNKKIKNKRNRKRAWGRICRRNVVFNDINENVYLM